MSDITSEYTIVDGNFIKNQNDNIVPVSHSYSDLYI